MTTGTQEQREQDVSTDNAEEPRFRPEPPALVGDFGQDDAFATESNPEGLRYGEQPHAPGAEHHGPKVVPEHPDHDEAVISIG